MKKVLASIVLIVYFCVSTGFVVSMHYCMDRFTSAEIGHSDAKKCDKCGMHKDGGCCRDEIRIVKLQTTHVHSVWAAPLLSAPVLPSALSVFILSPLRNVPEKNHQPAHGPPLPGDKDSYLLHCVFRI